MNDLAIFIDSYDGNSDVWSTFFTLFNIFWKDCRFDRYLISNSSCYDTDNLTVISTGDERGWFHMTIKGLEAVKEEYILFLLEDYAFSKTIKNQDFDDIINRMEAEGIYYYRLTSPAKFPADKSFVRVPEATPYPISLQPAVWHRQKFLETLKELYSKGARTPWDFEKYFIDKFRGGRTDVMIVGIRYDTRNLLGYQNLIIQGKWDPRVVKFYKKKGISIVTGRREYMPTKAVFLDGIKRNKLIRLMSNKSQARIKRILKKLGIDFMT